MGREVVAFFVVGVTMFSWHAAQVIESRLQAGFDGDSMLTVIRIIEFPRNRGDSVSFVARTHRRRADSATDPAELVPAVAIARDW